MLIYKKIKRGISMKKTKYILAYALGILGWFLGIIIGVIWALLYGGYKETNIIDIPTLLMENITPAIVSIYMGNYIFNKTFPKDKNKTLNFIIFYVILFLNYGYILCDIVITANYTNIIYVITGVIYLIFLIIRLLKENNK